MQTPIITIQKSEVQLNHLIKTIQSTETPVLLKQDGNTLPVAFMMPVQAQQRIGLGQDASTFMLTNQIELLRAFVNLWQTQLKEEPDTHLELQSLYAPLLDSRLRLLIKLNTNQPSSNSTLNALIMLLRLGIDQISTIRHLQAFGYGLDTLLTSNLTPEHIALVDEALLDAGIEARADFSDPGLLQQYVEVL